MASKNKKTRYPGLSKHDVIERQKQHGKNIIEKKSKKSPVKLLLGQLKSNYLIYLLLVASILSFLLGKNITAWTILFVVAIIMITTFIQEFRAEKAIEALMKMVLPITTVIREGREKRIESINIVPDDIVVLHTGERVPADGQILESSELRVNEAILTGEAKEMPKVSKENKTADSNDTADKIFMGTFVINGKCIFKVTHIGMNTQFGKIAKMISSVEKQMPLQIKVNKIVKYMALLAIGFSVIVGVLSLYRTPEITTSTIIEIAIVVIALMVSAFPEGFPVVLTSTLASGAYRMAKKNAIVNKMSIIETFGETTVICSDKTGTITKGEMTVKKILCASKIYFVDGAGYTKDGSILDKNEKTIEVKNNANLFLLIKGGVLCNDAKIEEEQADDYKINGTPTEASLLILGVKANIFEDDFDYERTEEIPFSSERKMMSVVVSEQEKSYVFSKGAPEILLAKCSKYINDHELRLSSEKKEFFLKENEKFNSEGFRTIALAYKSIQGKELNKDQIENDLTFIGIMGIEDPPREEVVEAIEDAEKAGIKVKMITGDHRDTAVSIAKQVGLTGKTLEGSAIDEMSDEELESTAGNITIFARVRPEHKLRIVNALKKKGEVVAMTGDGVNDAPALREANIGVAMGKNGTDVTREVADLTLKDDNFATLVEAISEGRTIFSNIRKFATYQLSCNFSELVLVLVSILLGLPLPLIALQILFINLVTDDLPAISLGFNPSSKDVMRVKPRKNSEILDNNLILLIVIIGVFMGLVAFSVYYVSYSVLGLGIEISRTNTFLVMIMLQIINAFGFRSLRSTMTQIPLTSNKYLIWASLISLIATFVVIHTPAAKIFEVTKVGALSWLFFFLLSFAVLWLLDGIKKYSKKRDIFLADVV